MNNQRERESYLCKLEKYDPKRGFLPVDEHSIKISNDGIASTITARYYKGISAHGDNCVLEIERNEEMNEDKKPNFLGSIYGKGTSFAGAVYSDDGISPCLNTMQGGNREPMILEENKIYVKQATESGYAECKVGGVCDISYPTSSTRRGRVQDDGDTSPAITVVGAEKIAVVETKYRIRKLTSRECWRLMALSGDNDENYEKAAKVNSESQLYKQAGNSIVVNVLEEIFAQLF